MLNRRAFVTASLAAASGSACQNISDAASGEVAWVAAPAMPYATQEIYPVLHGTAIWVAGGFSPQADGATERVIAFDLAANKWIDAPPMPTPSHHVQLASVGGELYAIGGFLGGATRRQWICTARVLKLEGDAWIEYAPLPRPMAESVSFVHDGRIHVIGGRSPRAQPNANYGDHVDIGDHFIFSAESGWTRGAPLPTPRNSAAVAKDGSLSHVISGRTADGAATGVCEIYDMRTQRWESGPTFPNPHGGLAAACWRGRVVAGGGELLQQGSVSDAVYARGGDGWARLETMPSPRHGFGLVAANGALFAIGGSRRVATTEPLSSVDVLS